MVDEDVMPPRGSQFRRKSKGDDGGGGFHVDGKNDGKKFSNNNNKETKENQAIDRQGQRNPVPPHPGHNLERSGTRRNEEQTRNHSRQPTPDTGGSVQFIKKYCFKKTR